MTEKSIKKNLEKAWEKSHASLILEAKEWYPKTRDYIEELAKSNSLEITQVSGIFSALSPQKSVSENKKLAEAFLKGKRSGHYRNQIKKAERILYTTRPRDIDKILHGYKTVSFFRHIYTPWDDRYCVNDSHIIKVSNGGKIAYITPKRYKMMSDCIKNHAKKVNLKVSECQAAFWLISKELYGNNV